MIIPNDSTYAVETSQVYYHTMQEDFTHNRLHPGIFMRFETCEVWVRLFKCVTTNETNIPHLDCSM